MSLIVKLHREGQLPSYTSLSTATSPLGNQLIMVAPRAGAFPNGVWNHP